MVGKVSLPANNQCFFPVVFLTPCTGMGLIAVNCTLEALKTSKLFIILLNGEMRCLIFCIAVYAPICSLLSAGRYGKQRQICDKIRRTSELFNWSYCLGRTRHKWTACFLSAHSSRCLIIYLLNIIKHVHIR